MTEPPPFDAISDDESEATAEVRFLDHHPSRANDEISDPESEASDNDFFNDDDGADFFDHLTSDTILLGNVTAPALGKWKEVDVFKSVMVSVAKAKRTMWTQAQIEIKTIKDNINGLEVLDGTTATTILSPLYKVYHHLFGSSSATAKCFYKYLKMKKKRLFAVFINVCFILQEPAVPLFHAYVVRN